MQNQPIPAPLLNITNLSIDELNTIFAALDELPQKRVRGVTDKLIAQVNAQLNPAIAAAANPGPTEPEKVDAAPAAGLTDPE